MFWVISVYFNVRNILPKSGTFPLGHPVYMWAGHGTYGRQEMCVQDLVERHEGKRTLGRRRRRWEDNFKTDLQ